MLVQQVLKVYLQKQEYLKLALFVLIGFFSRMEWAFEKQIVWLKGVDIRFGVAVIVSLNSPGICGAMFAAVYSCHDLCGGEL